MNCLKCQKRIRTPRHDYAAAELVEKCRACCLACNPDEMPRGGRSQVQATDFTLSKRKTDPCDEVPIAQNLADTDVDGITPEAFDRLRTAMTALFALQPIDLVIVQQLINGSSYEQAAAAVVDILRKVDRYHGSARQMVYARKNNIIARFPAIKGAIEHAVANRDSLRRRIAE